MRSTGVHRPVQKSGRDTLAHANIDKWPQVRTQFPFLRTAHVAILPDIQPTSLDDPVIQLPIRRVKFVIACEPAGFSLKNVSGS